MIALFGNKGMLGKEFVESFSKYVECSFSDDDFDFVDYKAVFNALKDTKVRWIVNCAAYTNVNKAEVELQKLYDSNVTIPKNLVKAANALGMGVFHYSTDYVFDGSSNRSYKETDPENPINQYGKSKLLGECEVKKASKYIIARISWLYGPYGKCFPKSILDKLIHEKKDVGVILSQTGTPTYTLDVAQNSIELMRTERSGVFHLTNSGSCTWYEFAKEIAKHHNLEENIFSVDDYKLPARRPKYSVMNTEKFQQHTGIIPRHWKFAVKDFLNRLEGEK